MITDSLIFICDVVRHTKRKNINNRIVDKFNNRFPWQCLYYALDNSHIHVLVLPSPYRWSLGTSNERTMDTLTGKQSTRRVLENSYPWFGRLLIQHLQQCFFWVKLQEACRFWLLRQTIEATSIFYEFNGEKHRFGKWVRSKF